jgi:transcriptional regulator with PAS, ATPase and Fis domain
MAMSYDAIRLLSSAYNREEGISCEKNYTENLRQCLKDMCLEGLQGKVIMSSKVQHLWQWSRLGRVQSDGNIALFWQSPGPVPPKFCTHPIDAVCSAIHGTSDEGKFNNIIGQNKNILACIKLAKVASTNNANVLLTGETGTGKEMIARAIHENSDRRCFPFVPINCVTIPKDLMASELFGYEEGAFTGAKKGGKIGIFENANGGTLFLDEIGEMANDLQANLLRAIEEKEIYRIGGNKPVKLSFRLITATNRDIEHEMHYYNSFRKDLFYRLSVFHIKLPRLCDRKDDIPELANHFLKSLCLKNSIKKSLLPESLKYLMCYQWPGNVRELKNIIERSFYISMNEKYIAPEHLPELVRNYRQDDAITNGETVDQKSKSFLISTNEFQDISLEKYRNAGCNRNLLIDDNERKLITIAIDKSKYNMTRAAKLLGVSRTTLYRKVKKYEISI